MYNIHEVCCDSKTMKEHGVQILTGEACALSMRLLCEVTPEMMQTYIEFTGIPVNIDDLPKSNYNNSKNYAVYLTWNTMNDLLIMSLVKKYQIVYKIIPNLKKESGFNRKEFLLCGDIEEIKEELKSGVYSQFVWDEEKGEYNKTEGIFDVGRSYSFSANPHRGFGNVHAMSGVSK